MIAGMYLFMGGRGPDVLVSIATAGSRPLPESVLFSDCIFSAVLIEVTDVNLGLFLSDVFV